MDEFVPGPNDERIPVPIWLAMQAKKGKKRKKSKKVKRAIVPIGEDPIHHRQKKEHEEKQKEST